MKRLLALILLTVNLAFAFFTLINLINNTIKQEYVLIDNAPPIIVAQYTLPFYKTGAHVNKPVGDNTKNFKWDAGTFPVNGINAGSSNNVSKAELLSVNSKYVSGKSSKEDIYGTNSSSSMILLASGSRTAVGGSQLASSGSVAASGTAVSGTTPVLFKAIGNGGEDDFETGAGTNPSNSYNDAPVGGGIIVLIMMALIYAGFIARRAGTNRTAL